MLSFSRLLLGTVIALPLIATHAAGESIATPDTDAGDPGVVGADGPSPTGDAVEPMPIAREMAMDDRASGFLGAAGPVDIWRIDLPMVSTSNEGWQGMVSILVEPEITGFPMTITAEGERYGTVVPLQSDESGSGFRAVGDDGAPIDALIIRIESNAAEGETTPYEIVVQADDCCRAADTTTAD